MKTNEGFRGPAAEGLGDLRHYVENQILPHRGEWFQNAHFPLETFQDLHRMGWLAPITPSRYGGSETPVSRLVLLARELAYGSLGVFTSVMANNLGYSPVVLYAAESLRSRLCQDTWETGAFWSFAMTEAATGFDVANLKTVARVTKGGFVIDGEKNFITNAGYARHLSVFARVETDEGQNLGVTCFYVPAETPGVERGPAMDKIGMKDSNTGTLYFRDVFIPTENRLGEFGEGLKILMHCLHRTKTMIGAASVGVSDRAFDLIVAHLRNRIAGGSPLLNKPTIQSLLVNLRTKVEAAWLLSKEAARVWDTGDFAIQQASMAKMFGANTAVEVVNEVLELFGARGFEAHSEIARLYHDVKALEIYEGSTQINEILIAKSLFGGAPGAKAREKSPPIPRPVFEELKKQAA